MRYYLLSDLHLEGAKYTFPQDTDYSNSVLILAGDILTLKALKTQNHILDFFSEASNRFDQVIYVAGNHEFYGSDYYTTLKELSNFCSNFSDNIHFLENEVYEIGGVSFIGATLWTDFYQNDPISKLEALRCMSDFRLIKNGENKFTPDFSIELHEKSLKFISEAITEEKMKGNDVVVVSHHLPSERSIHPKYFGSSLNGAFCSDLDFYIENFVPDVWVHGHTHESFCYRVYKTMVYCNPKGYKNLEYNGIFNPNFNFEV